MAVVKTSKGVVTIALCTTLLASVWIALQYITTGAGTIRTATGTILQVSVRAKTPVLTINFPGQQGSGALCLSTLQCFLSSVYEHFYLVEPYLQGSHLTPYSSDSPQLQFSSIFNFDHFNSESKKFHYAEMMPLNEFKSLYSHRKYVIYIRTSFWQNVVWSANVSDDGREECYNGETLSAKFGINDTMEILNRINPEICIVRILQLQAANKDGIIFSNTTMQNRSLKSVQDFIFDRWPPKDVLVVFKGWGKRFVPVQNPLNDVFCLKQYAQSTNYLKQQFTPSNRLIHDAEKYEKMFLGSRNRLSIMFRLERALWYIRELSGRNTKQKKVREITKCFQQVLNYKAKLENGSSIPYPLVTLDLGVKYGTDTYSNKQIGNIAKSILERYLYHGQWTITNWENSFVNASGGVSHRGYIAALQRLLASRAECMILMGGGDYQALAVSDYLEFHGTRHKKCVELVCVMAKTNDEVRKTLKL